MASAPDASATTRKSTRERGKRARSPSPTPEATQVWGVRIEEYICPISLEVFADPVTCVDGHTYEKKAIKKWLRKSPISPKTGLNLPSRLLVPNLVIRRQTEELLSKHPELRPKQSYCLDAFEFKALCDTAGRMSGRGIHAVRPTETVDEVDTPKEVVTDIIAYMASHEADAQIQQDGLKALESMARQPSPAPVRAALAEAQGFTQVFASAAAHRGSREIQNTLIAIVAEATSAKPASRDRAVALLDAGAVEAVLAAMAAHENAPDLQDACYRALRSLLLENLPAAGHSRVDVAAVVAAVVAGMRRHKHQSVLQSMGCQILNKLAAGTGGAAAVMAAGAVEAVLDAIRVARGDSATQEAGCTFIAAVAGASPESRTALQEKGAVAAVVRLLTGAQCSDSLRRAAATALHKLGTLGDEDVGRGGGRYPMYHGEDAQMHAAQMLRRAERAEAAAIAAASRGARGAAQRLQIAERLAMRAVGEARDPEVAAMGAAAAAAQEQMRMLQQMEEDAEAEAEQEQAYEEAMAEAQAEAARHGGHVVAISDSEGSEPPSEDEDGIGSDGDDIVADWVVA